MKKQNIKFNIFILLVILAINMISCDEEADFGFNASISGMIKDGQGNPVHGDVLRDNLVVNLLGEGDAQVLKIRVLGDGTYQHTKIFPKKHKIFVSGPVIFTDTITNDFSDVVNLEKDFSVTPYISANITNATVNGTSVNVDYSIAANAGHTVVASEIYCSTARYPTSSIGSRDGFYFTKTVGLSELSGNVDITELPSGSKYYIRIGSLADGTTLENYSNQVEVTIP